MKSERNQNDQNNFEKNKAEENTDFRTYYKAAVVKTVWHCQQNKTYRSIKEKKA